MKRVLYLFLCMALTAAAVDASTFPDKMYIKGVWNGSSWVWKTMTTVADGIYTYEAKWNNLYGCNINSVKSDSGSAWYKYNTIVGYDESINGEDVVLTYVASCEMLYVARADGSSVVLVISQPGMFTGQPIALSAWCRNLTDPTLTFTLTDSEGNVTTLDGDNPSFTVDAPGTYTMGVTATPQAGAADETEAVCTVTRDFTEYVGPEPCPFTPSELDKKLGWHEDEATSDITFIFDPATWGRQYEKITSVYVSGSFNGWSSTSDDNFKLRQDPDRKLLYLTVPYNTAKRPGNIGQPEFKFVINGTYSDPYSSYPADYIYNSNGNKNMIIVFSRDNLEQVRQTIAGASVIKKVSDFDLDTAEGREEISNYRTVPATSMLKRCYHPFKITSRTDMSTEPVRIAWVNNLAVADGVSADICLSGDDTGSLGTYTADGVTYTEEVPDYYRQMIARGDVLYVGQGYKTPSYNEVYYNIRSDNFGRWIKDVAEFINDDDRQGPFTIHCRLGTDRTGVFCATLAALCGASWEAIVADYQKSNRMGINEFRSHKLLQYAFEDMLGVTDIAEVADVAASVKNYLTNGGWLTDEDIDRLRSKLNGNPAGLSAEKMTDKGVKVTVRAGAIDIVSPHRVDIYTPSGLRVYAGKAGTVSLPAGLYIVTTGGEAAKAVVR